MIKIKKESRINYPLFHHKITYIQKTLLTLFLCIFTQISCQTWNDNDYHKDILLSSHERDLFQSSADKDGGLALSIKSHSTSFFPIANLDWVSEENGQWIAQLYDPLGRTVLDMSWQEKDGFFKIKGPLSAKTPQISVDENGFLEIEDHFIGLKAKEVASLMNSYFPLEWLNQIRKRESKKSSKTYFIQDEYRKIEILVTEDNEKPDLNNKCAQIYWRSYWGLKSNRIKWCIESLGEASTLYLDHDTALKWVNTDA